MATLRRLVRHFCSLPHAVSRVLPASSLAAIERAIAQAEAGHRGEIRFAVESSLDAAALLRGQSARERALEAFAHLRVWDTEENNGVLVFLLLADRDIEIVADRGVSARVPQAEWARICRVMEAALRRGDFQQGIVDGIAEIGRLLAQHFPARPGERNELPDKPAVL